MPVLRKWMNKRGMRMKCEKCNGTKWLVYYDDVRVKYDTTMTSVVEYPEDVGGYNWKYTDVGIAAEDVPVEIDTAYSGVVVSCLKCGWEAEPDTEEALEEWLANEKE